ncbi:MAG: matrixin family metalloprotease [Archangium sp.]|nr:matrixin family metalloprotease [Archangium sp.]
MLHKLLPLLCLTLSLPCAAWDVRTDSEGDLVRWGKPLVMVLDAKAGQLLRDSRAETAIAAAVKNFEDATPYLEVSMTIGEGKPMGYVVGASDNQNSILVLEDWPYSEDALAVTLVTLNARTNELLDADVAFNVESHRFKVLPEAAKDERQFDDVQNTITHELGHVLGLMHNNATEDLVMYPSAPPGEVSKRTLKADDRDGLLSLYGLEPEPSAVPPVFAGCSSTASSPVWLLLPMMMLALLKRSRRLALVALVPAISLAAEPLPAAVSRASEIALVQVTGRQSHQHPTHPGLIVTQLAVSPIECLKGACAGFSHVVVAGGRLGDLEQLAVHQPVPAEGQRVLVTRTNGRVRVLWVEPDVQARIVQALRSSSGWVVPQGSASPPSPSAQTPAITP